MFGCVNSFFVLFGFMLLLYSMDMFVVFFVVRCVCRNVCMFCVCVDVVFLFVLIV